MTLKKRATLHRGFTIIELMVAMTLGLIMLAGALSVLFSSRITFMENERVAHLQENVRAGMDMIQRDLRGAGYPGCAHPQSPDEFDNVLVDPAHVLRNFGEPLTGFEASADTWAPELPAILKETAPLAGNDILVVRSIRSNTRFFRTPETMTSDTEDIVVMKEPLEEIPAYPAIFISDCVRSAVFAATAVTPSADGKTVAIAHSDTGNSRKELQVFNAGALVAPVDTVVYFIAKSQDSEDDENPLPSLWRIVSSEPAAKPSEPQEMVAGVEAMQIEYGEDTTGDLLVDAYKKANDVINWENVIAVKIALLIRSVEETGMDTDTGTYNLLGTDISPGDRRQRTPLTTTVTLRNRAM